MISEKDFARSFGSFWRETLPFCESFVRQLNSSLIRSYATAIMAAAAPSRRALVNEVGLALFERARLEKSTPASIALDARTLDELQERVRLRLRVPMSTSETPPSRVVAETAESLGIAERLDAYFAQRDELIFRPRFRGCGALAACEGDILSRETLYEIKSGDRDFRAEDVRQLLIYMALAAEARDHKISRISLLNPRRAVVFVTSVEDLCLRAAGDTSVHVHERIIAHLSVNRSY